MSLCLASVGLAAELAVSAFTLSWTHTIEKTEWREDWRIEDAMLVLVEAKIEASGAGMEPPPDARLEGGFYVWMPDVPPLEEVVLRRQPLAGDWTLCTDEGCAPLGEWLGGEAEPVRLSVTTEGGCETLEPNP